MLCAKKITKHIAFVIRIENKLFGFFLGDLRTDPQKPRGDFKKNPEGPPHARGVFLKSPTGLRGIW